MRSAGDGSTCACGRVRSMDVRWPRSPRDRANGVFGSVGPGLTPRAGTDSTLESAVPTRSSWVSSTCLRFWARLVDALVRSRCSPVSGDGCCSGDLEGAGRLPDDWFRSGSTASVWGRRWVTSRIGWRTTRVDSANWRGPRGSFGLEWSDGPSRLGSIDALVGFFPADTFSVVRSTDRPDLLWGRGPDSSIRRSMIDCRGWNEVRSVSGRTESATDRGNSVLETARSGCWPDEGSVGRSWMLVESVSGRLSCVS